MSCPKEARFNPVALTLQVDARLAWHQVERFLADHQATLGWHPPLTRLQSLGEVLETACDGLRATLYGSPRDNCVALTVRLADGSHVSSLETPRSAAGPDWKHLLLGGNGESGTIECATMRVYPRPTRVEPAAYRFSRTDMAVKAAADLIHHGAIPAAGALAPGDTGVELLLTFEGSRAICGARAAIADRICTQSHSERLDPTRARAWMDDLVEADPERPVAETLFFSPDLRVDALWDRVPALVDLVQARSCAFVVTGFRHTGAALLLDLSAIQDQDRKRFINDLQEAGAVLPFDNLGPGPVGRHMRGLLRGTDNRNGRPGH